VLRKLRYNDRGLRPRSCGKEAISSNGSGGLLVADHDENARSSLVALLEEEGFRVRQAANGEEALGAARKERPSAVLLEVALPQVCGYEVCRALRTEFGPSLPIVFVSGVRTESYDRVAGLLVGADDYVVRPYARDELLARVRRLVRNSPISDNIASRLTKREAEVLGLLAEGLEHDEIARKLFISPKTVGTHIEHILAKLGVRSRAQAVALAYRGDFASRAA
jgi:DNA-binding NarL/FixJ family response regulator